MDIKHSTPGVSFDGTTPALVITHLVVTSPGVTTEALRWASGVRGPTQAAESMHGADLTAYAEQALVVGAQAIAAAGGTQDTFNLEQLVQDVGTRTSEAATRAATSTTKVVDEASKAVRDASTEATKALATATEAARTSFGASVSEAGSQLREQVLALVGGDDPQIAVRLETLLAKFGAELTERTNTQTSTLFASATKALNPDDPTSPLAKHQTQLRLQHKELAKRLEGQNAQLMKAVGDVQTALAVQTSARSIASVTPLKGGSYEERNHALLHQIATGLSDEYVETGTLVGTISRCKKGDGLLTVMGGPARVVVEMSDSTRTDWSAYLDEAERNRSANASLGLVPTMAQNGEQSVRVLGPRRIVMAFDPTSDDPALLRTVMQLLRVAALAGVSRREDGGGEVAAERIAEALAALPRIEKIRKAASAIRKGAENIDTEGDRLSTQLNRLLLQAKTALAGVRLASVDAPSSAGSEPDASSGVA